MVGVDFFRGSKSKTTHQLRTEIERLLKNRMRNFLEVTDLTLFNLLKGRAMEEGISAFG